MDTTTISIIIAIIGCLVGISGWTSRRDDKTGKDAEWRGSMSAKLDTIMASVTGLRGDVERINKRLTDQGERIAKCEASCSSAHKRVDALYAALPRGEE